MSDDSRDPLSDSLNAAIEQENEKKILTDRVEELTQQMQSFKEAASRAQAELQNAKIRMERELSSTRQYATQHVLLSLLPIIDNFSRATKHLPESLTSNEWAKGMLGIFSQLQKALTDAGVASIPSLGESVDANLHEVILEGPGKKGVITDVFEEGYLLHGKILRPAKVKVGNGESTAQETKTAA